MYQWDSSRDYNASPGLERIQAALLAINSADDERNPPETGIMERELKRVKNGRLYLIPASEETRGHGTTGLAKFWSKQLGEFLQSVPKRERNPCHAGLGEAREPVPRVTNSTTVIASLARRTCSRLRFAPRMPSGRAAQQATY